MKVTRWTNILALALVLGATAACGQPPAGEGPAAGGDADTAADATAPAPAEGGAPAAGMPGAPDDPIVMSFVPSGETEAITAGADTIRDLLSAETGLSIETNVATSYAAVIEAMGAGNAHVAWLPTLSYILAHEKYGAEPILVVGRYGTTTYASQIITRVGGGVATLADLKGKTFCRPDALSTSGWVVPSVMLQAEGVAEADLGKVVDAGGHDGVVTAVYKGDCDAGATFVDARGEVEDQYPDVKRVIEVVATSADIPNDNVSVAADLPDDVVAKIKDGLVAIGQTPEGAEALKTVYGVETLEPADDTFYDAFRVTLDKAGIDVASLMQE